MKFQLTRPYSSYDELMKAYGDILKDFGYEEKRMAEESPIDYLNFYDDDCDNIRCSIVINSLDELLELKRRLKCNVIIENEEGVDVLEIYDGYRE